MLETRDLRHVKTIAEIADYVRQQAAGRQPGEWIVGRNWDQTNWGSQFPSARDLDAAAPGHPVLLTRVDGHAAWVNSVALKLCAITPETPDPPGGKIIRDAAGRPTGMLIDGAQGLVRSHMPPPTPERARRQLALAARECSRLGLTTIHDAGITSSDLDAYRALLAAGDFPLRIYAMIGGPCLLYTSRPRMRAPRPDHHSRRRHPFFRPRCLPRSARRRRLPPAHLRHDRRAWSALARVSQSRSRDR